MFYSTERADRPRGPDRTIARCFDDAAIKTSHIEHSAGLNGHIGQALALCRKRQADQGQLIDGLLGCHDYAEHRRTRNCERVFSLHRERDRFPQDDPTTIRMVGHETE